MATATAKKNLTATAAATANAPVVTLSTQVTFAGRKYTLANLCKQAAAEYEAIHAMHEEMLPKYKYIGETLLALRSLIPNKNQLGEFIAQSPLAGMSRQDRSDAMHIAENWATIQRLNKGGKLESLGVSAIRKRLAADKADQVGEKAPTSAGNVSKGKPKAGKADKAMPHEATVQALAAYVHATCKQKGFDLVELIKAIGALENKSPRK